MKTSQVESESARPVSVGSSDVLGDEVEDGAAEDDGGRGAGPDSAKARIVGGISARISPR